VYYHKQPGEMLGKNTISPPIFLDFLGRIGRVLVIDWLVIGHFICVYSSMWIVYMTTDFFLEIPSFEELQDPNGSPRREEVGRPALVTVSPGCPALGPPEGVSGLGRTPYTGLPEPHPSSSPHRITIVPTPLHTVLS
jgi:hypothetical protein